MQRGPRGRARSGNEPEPRTLPAEGAVTAIKSQQRDPERVNIFLDGEYALALTREVAAREGVRVGRRLTVDEVAALRALDDVSKATEAGIRLLTARPRAEKELRTRLRQKGYEAGAIDAAIERLRGWGYLDDEAFARTWVANRMAHRPRGSRLLAQELRHKGVDRDQIASAIEEAGVDEVAAATEVARKQAAKLSGLEPDVARRRLTGFLGRRGFDYGTIKAALAAIDLESDADDADDSDPDAIDSGLE
jgi:regulatory protein